MDQLLFFYWGWAGMLVSIVALSLLLTNLFERLFLSSGQPQVRPQNGAMRHSDESQMLYLSEFGSALGMNNANLNNANLNGQEVPAMRIMEIEGRRQ